MNTEIFHVHKYWFQAEDFIMIIVFTCKSQLVR